MKQFFKNHKLQQLNEDEIDNLNSPITNLKIQFVGFPGGPVVKNLPANAGDTGSIPGLGRFHSHGGTKSTCCNY